MTTMTTFRTVGVDLVYGVKSINSNSVNWTTSKVAIEYKEDGTGSSYREIVKCFDELNHTIFITSSDPFFNYFDRLENEQVLKCCLVDSTDPQYIKDELIECFKRNDEAIVNVLIATKLGV